MNEPRYPFVAVDVPAEESEELGATLFELGASGVEERDDGTLIKGSSSGVVTLVASFETHEAANEAIAELVAAMPHLAPRLEEVVGDAWRDAWKEHFAPFLLTPRIRIYPPWAERPAAENDEIVLELEPGRAFGTGLHASTSLIAEILDESSATLKDRELLDVGTGSGILALVALVYGASRAVAIDIDPDVVGVVNENAERNGLSARVEASAGTVESIARSFPWVLANIEARVLRPIAAELDRVLAPGGTLILSGVLESEHDEMVALYTSLPRKLVHATTKRRSDATGDGWVAIAFTAPA